MADIALGSVKTLADIVLQINEAVETVQQNKKECLRISQSARTYCGFVESMVKGTDITQNEFLRETLENAKSTFEEALKVVEKCQEKHIFCHFFWAKDIADELKNVQKDLKMKIQYVNTCGTVHNVTAFYAATMAPPPRTAPPPPPPLPPGTDDIEVVHGGFARFSWHVLMQATNEFSDEKKIGQGAFSSMYKMIQEIAQGVHYIHEQRVIHLDLKPSNVLFNSDMTPVIIDFGISKVLAQGEDKIHLENVLGTLGYIAPERLSHYVVSFKSDVYSFGITLLRTILTLDALRNGIWLWEPAELKASINPAVQVDDSQLTEITRCVLVGHWCLEQDPADRPSMADVIDMLSGKKMVPAPKKQEKQATKKAERSVTKKVERAFSKKLGRADSKT